MADVLKVDPVALQNGGNGPIAHAGVLEMSGPDWWTTRP